MPACVAACRCPAMLPELLPFPDLQLPAEKQRSIAEELDRSPGEVLKKLEDIRNKLL